MVRDQVSQISLHSPTLQYITIREVHLLTSQFKVKAVSFNKMPPIVAVHTLASAAVVQLYLFLDWAILATILLHQVVSRSATRLG